MLNRVSASLLHRSAAGLRMATAAGRFLATQAAGGGEDTERRFGELLAEELDQLKGLSMKAGQILSSMDAGLPEGVRQRLARVQTGREGVAWPIIAEEIRRGLGQAPEALFARIDPVPVAAASVGQVHRAWLEEAGGLRAVAVKVRYPGVEESLAADLAVVARLARLASLASAVDGEALLAEVQRHFLEECDYAAERAGLLEAGAAIRGMDGVRVPQPVADRCAPNVLTMGWEEGAPLSRWLEQDRAIPPGIAERLLRLPWWTMGACGLLHADPHPGNFLVGADGALVVLDWGCHRRITGIEADHLRRLIRTLQGGGSADLRRTLEEIGFVGDAQRFDMSEAERMFRWMFQPYLSPRFRFSLEWMREGQAFSSPRAKNARRMDIPPLWVWLLRVFFGLHTLAARAGLEGDLRGCLSPLTGGVPAAGTR